MADVTLAEVDGQGWLVAGDQHVDGLLAGTLAPTVTVEVIGCATRAEAWAMWEATSPYAVEGGMPWLIHPAILRRIKGALDEQCIRFTPWSAMLTEDARSLIASTAGWLAANPTGRLTLRQFAPAEPPPGLPDLQRLRAQLVTGAFAAAGADTARLEAETSASDAPADCERFDLVSVTSTAITGE